MRLLKLITHITVVIFLTVFSQLGGLIWLLSVYIIEPYLKKSLGLGTESKIRFQGCQAVRHDDHIHLELK